MILAFVFIYYNQRRVCNNIDGKNIDKVTLPAVSTGCGAALFAGVIVEIEDIVNRCLEVSLRAHLFRVQEVAVIIERAECDRVSDYHCVQHHDIQLLNRRF